MASKGIASFNDPEEGRVVPARAGLSTPFVREFRKLIKESLDVAEPISGEPLRSCVGIYVFYDYDGEPIYVGQTMENLGTRVGRHLTGQRTDTVAYRILDPHEVAMVEIYPAQHLKKRPGDSKETKSEKCRKMDTLEYSVYVNAIENSKYKAILNEKIPPVSPVGKIPQPIAFDLVPESMREEREHPDVRIERRAETLSQLTKVALTRGEVSAGLRRVIVMQAVRLADLSAARLAFAEGRRGPNPEAIDVQELVGNVMAENDDHGTADS